MKKLVIIDANNFIYRAFYGIQQNLTAPDGTPVNAIYGTFNMVHRLILNLNPTSVVVAQDSRKSLRKEQYPQYKENRSKMPEDLLKQIPFVYDMFTKMGLHLMEIEGYEADDVINSLVKSFEDSFDEIYIASSDKDLMQLVSAKVKCIDTMKDKTYEPADVEEKLGVSPNQIVDYLALVGDSSDNIPGVKGIGEKTAVKLLKEFGNIENLYKKINSLPESKTKQNLIADEESAKISYSLAQLKLVDMPKELPVYSKKISPDLILLLDKLNMKSAIGKLSLLK